MDGLWDSPGRDRGDRGRRAQPATASTRSGGALTPVREPWQRGRALLERNTPLRSREDIAAHYDLGNDLFELMLDETMMYSSAIFERRDMSLEEASRAKLDRICDKLDLGPSDHVLEIGTGWGGFAVHAAPTRGLPRDDDDAVARAARAGAGAGARGRACEDRVTILLDDYRELTGSYDKLVSIEMIEAVGWKDFGTFFDRCASLLRPGRRDGAAGDHDRRPPLRRREGPALVHELADLPERLPAVGRGDRAQRRPPQRPADGRPRGHHAALRRDAAALAGERRGARGRGCARWATTSASSGCGGCT